MAWKLLFLLLGFLATSSQLDVAAEETLPRSAVSATKRYTQDVLNARSKYLNSLEKLIGKTKNPDHLVALAEEVKRVRLLAGDTESLQRGMFAHEKLVGKKVLLMCPHRNYRIQLMGDGTLSPKLHAEHFWRVNNGSLEFLGRNKREVAIKWSFASETNGVVHAFSFLLNDVREPRVLVVRMAKQR